MSRTEGVHLPRLPTSHTRVTSSRAMRHHAAADSSLRAETRRRSLSEPSYTSYVGTPRQDIPHPVLSNAAMYDDVFDREGRLLGGRNTAKFTSPLHTVGYNSLNDPHCRKLFLNNKRLRYHLINLGLITDDLKVVATTKEQRQKIRAHELLERKELLAQKLEEREQERLQRLCQPFQLPRSYEESIARHQQRQQQWVKVQEMKTKKIIRQQEQERAERTRKLQQKRVELEKAMDEAKLQEQAHRNTLRVQQQMAEMRAYETAYGKTAHWHREADKINNRMVAMKLQWAKKKQHSILSQSFPPPSLSHQSFQEGRKLKPLHKPEETGRKVVTSPEETKPEREGVRVEVEGEEEGGGKNEEGEKRASEDVSGRGEKQETEDSMIGAVERERATPNKEKIRIPPRTGEELNEHVTKEPPPHSLEPQPLPVAEQPQHTVAEGDQAKLELTKILIDALHSVEGEGGTGYISVEDFLQVLVSPDLGLHLEDSEQIHIATQVDPSGDGVVVYTEAVALVPDLLLQIFSLRAEQSMQFYGYYVEEEWVQMYPVSGGVVYLNKLTGRLQNARPDEFRPFLKNEVFEDSLVDFFETADTDRDGLIDYEDFYNLLASPQVASRVYRGQMEQLLSLYQSQTADTGGQMNLSFFPALANPLLLMIYQNAYPDVEEWIELESKKFGSFWLNKSTGEIVLQPQSAGVSAGGSDMTDLSLEKAERMRRKSKSKKKRKHRKKSGTENDRVSPDPLPTAQSESSNQERDPSHYNIGSEPVSSSLEQPPVEKEEVAKPDPIKPVSSRSRLLIPAIFETIPEEDETALGDSLLAGTNVGEGERKREGEGETREKREGETGEEGEEIIKEEREREVETVKSAANKEAEEKEKGMEVEVEVDAVDRGAVKDDSAGTEAKALTNSNGDT